MPFTFGAPSRDKNDPPCDRALVGSHGVRPVSGLLFQSHGLLSCQPGPGAVVYLMLFHAFLSQAVTLPWGCVVSLPTPRVDVLIFPTWSPENRFLYPVACAFGGGWGLVSRTALRGNTPQTRFPAGRLAQGSSRFQQGGRFWPRRGPRGTPTPPSPSVLRPRGAHPKRGEGHPFCGCP